MRYVMWKLGKRMKNQFNTEPRDLSGVRLTRTCNVVILNNQDQDGIEACTQFQAGLHCWRRSENCFFQCSG